MKQSLSVLLAGTVDYAGLFPPAALDMQSAVQSYATYLTDPARFMLARFVVPIARLREFDEAAGPLLPRGDGSTPWHLSALPGPDVRADIDLALTFNSRHASDSEIGHAVIDALEIKAPTAADISAAMAVMPRQFDPFFELPLASDPRALVSELRRTGGKAKARTGGVTADAFPDAANVARFMLRCRDERVPFKLTAGLHHPIRATYRLTYAPDAPTGTMFGYLNMFVGAALAWDGADEATVLAALTATDVTEFEFGDDALQFRNRRLSLAALQQARSSFIISFGSCSFREPVDDLAALSLF